MAGQRPSPSLSPSPSPSPFLFPSPVGSIPLKHTTTSVKFDPLARSSLEDLLFRIEIPLAKIKHVRLPLENSPKTSKKHVAYNFHLN